jgi:hypothetical protein
MITLDTLRALHEHWRQLAEQKSPALWPGFVLR